MAKKQKRIYRSETDQVIGGVCAGVAQYFDLDPTLVRIAFVVLAFGQIGIPLYIVMWIVVPTKSKIKSSTEANIESNLNEIKNKAESAVKNLDKNKGFEVNPFGIILVLVGLYFLLSNFGWLDWLSWNYVWPFILIGLGVLALRR